jgi:hypothetical protein
MTYITAKDYYEVWNEKGGLCPFFLLDFSEMCIEVCDSWENYFRHLRNKSYKILTKPSYINKVEKKGNIYIEFCQETLHSSTAHHLLADISNTIKKYYYKPEQLLLIIDPIEHNVLRDYFQGKITWIKEYKHREEKCQNK